MPRFLALRVPRAGCSLRKCRLPAGLRSPRKCASSMLQIAEEFCQWHRIQNTIRRYAALARHLDAPVHVVELADRMRIRIDAHHAAEVQSGLVPPPIKI